MQLGEVYFDIAVNQSSIDSSIEQIKRKYTTQIFKIQALVDDTQLTRLNKHLDLKKKHFNDLQKHLKSNPLKIYVDDTELTKIKKEITTKIKFDIEANTINTNTSSSSTNYSNIRIENTLNSISSDLKVLIKSVEQLNKNTVLNGQFKPFQTIGRGLFEGIGKNLLDAVTQGVATAVKTNFNVGVADVVQRATNKAATPYKRDLNKDIFGNDISASNNNNNNDSKQKKPTASSSTTTANNNSTIPVNFYKDVKIPEVINNNKENVQQIKSSGKLIQALINKNFSKVVSHSIDIISAEYKKDKPDVNIAKVEFEKIKTSFAGAYKNLQKALTDNNSKLAKAYAESILSTSDKAKADIDKITSNLSKSGLPSQFGSELKTLSGSTKGVITSRYVNPTKRTLTALNNSEEFGKTVDIGKDVLKGLTVGLKDKSGVIREGSDLSFTLLNAIRKSLGIASPSKKAIEIMAFFRDGMLIGLTQAKQAVGGAAKDLGDILLPKGESLKNEATKRVKSVFPNLLPKTFEERKQEIIDRRNAVVDPLGLNYIKRSIRQGISGQPIESLYKDGKFTPSTKLADNAGSIKFFENLYERITRQATVVSNREFGKKEGSTIARQAGTMLATNVPGAALAGLASPLAIPLLPTVQAFNLAKKIVTPIIEQLGKAIDAVVPLQLTLSNLRGSEEKGKETLSYLQDFSGKTGTNLGASSKGFVDLSFATKGTKLEGDKTKDLYEGIATASKFVGATSAETSLIFQSFIQMVSKGKISMEELRQQLSEKFPPAMQVFAKALGVSTSELTTLVGKGALLAEDVLPKVAEVLKKDFSESANSAANNYVTASNRMENVTFNFYTKLVDSLGGLKTFALNIGSSLFETFNNNFQNINKVFNIGLITLAASTAAGFSAILSAPSLAPKVAIVSNFFTATFRKGFSLATPFIAGMLIDLLDDVLGAKNNVFDNISKGITNAFIGAFTVIDDLAKGFTGKSLFTVDLGDLGTAKNTLQQFGDTLKGIFSFIPSGVAEFGALILAFQQMGLLASAYVIPSLLKIRDAIGVFAGGVGNAIFNLGNIRDSLKDFFPGILHSAKNVLGVISGFALNAVGALAVLALSQSDFANPLQKSFGEAAFNIRASIQGITSALAELRQKTVETGKAIKESFELKSKGLELNPLKILGISDESSSFKSDKFFRFINRSTQGDVQGSEKDYVNQNVQRAKKLGLGDFVSQNDRYLTEAQKQLLGNAEDITGQGTQLKSILSQKQLTPEKIPSFLSSPDVKNNLESVKKIDEQLKELGSKRADLGIINTNEARKQISVIDIELRKLEDKRSEKIKPINTTIGYLNEIKDSVSKQIDATNKSDYPTAAKKALVNILKPQEESIQKSIDALKKAGVVDLLKPLEQTWTNTLSKLKDVNVEYDKLKETNKILSNTKEAAIVGNLGQTDSTKKNRLNDLNLTSLERDKTKLTDVNAFKKNTLREFLSVSNVETSDSRKKEIDSLREDIKKSNLELSELDLKIAQTREQNYKEQVSITKNIADYYVGIANQAEISAIDTKKLINSNRTNEGQNRLRKALESGHDNIVTQYIDSIIESLGQKNNVADKALEAQKQLVQIRQTGYDQQKAYNDITRSIPESISTQPSIKPNQLVDSKIKTSIPIDKPVIINTINANLKKEAVEVEKSLNKIDLLKKEFSKGNYLAFVTIPLDDLNKAITNEVIPKFKQIGTEFYQSIKSSSDSVVGYLKGLDFSFLSQSFIGLGLIFTDLIRISSDWFKQLIPVDDISKVLSQSFTGLGFIFTDLGKITSDWFNRLIPIDDINKVLNQSFIGIGLILQGIGKDTYNWVNSVIPLDGILTAINQSFLGLGLIIDDVIKKTQEWIGFIQQGLNGLGQAAQNITQDATTGISTAANGFGESVKQGWNQAVEWVTGGGSKIKPTKIMESVGRSIQNVNTYADLEKHHPSAGIEAGRNYDKLDGHLEEVRNRNGTRFVKKDFILEGGRGASVPSPVGGVIKQTGDEWNTTHILDPQTKQILATFLHLSSIIKSGTVVKPGDRIGSQSDVGSPGSIHVHAEMVRKLFEAYIPAIRTGDFTKLPSGRTSAIGNNASSNMVDARKQSANMVDNRSITTSTTTNNLGQLRRGGNDLTPAEIARLTPQGKQLYQYRNDPRVLAVADTVARAEGTDFRGNSKNFGYGMMIGGENTKDFSTHPFVGTGRKPRHNSTASGRYQLMNFNWKGSDSERLFTGKQAPSFTPGVQDLFLLGALKKRGVLDEVLKGDIQGAFSKPNVNSLAAEYASLEHNGRPSYYSGQGTPEGRKKQTIPFTQQRLQARLNQPVTKQASQTSQTVNNVVKSALQYRPVNNTNLRQTVQEARQIQLNTTNEQFKATQVQSQQDLAKEKDDYIRKQNAALRTFQRAGEQLDDSDITRRRNQADLGFQNLKNPSPGQSQNNEIIGITRRYDDLLKENRRNLERREEQKKDAEGALSTGVIPEGQSVSALKERLAKDNIEIASLKKSIPELEKLRAQAISESEKLFKRDESLRLQNTNFELRTQELTKNRSDLEALKTQSGLTPYRNIALEIPALERKLQLGELDLELEKSIADIEEKRFKNTFSADPITNNKLADEQIELLKKQNLSKQEGVDLTFQQADANARLEFGNKIIERENTLLGIRNDMRQEELKTLELIQKRNPLIRAGEQITIQKSIEDEARKNELIKKQFDTTNDTKLSPIERLQDLAKINELYRTKEQNANEQFALDTEQQSITNLQTLATRNSSQRDFLSKPGSDLINARANQITSLGGNQFEANALQRPNARLQENNRYAAEIDSFNSQAAELKFQGLITDEQIAKMKEALSAIHDINLENVNDQFKTFGRTIDDIAKSSIKGLASGLTDVILKGGSLVDVFTNFAETLLSSALQTGLDSLLSSLTGSLFGGGGKGNSPLGGGGGGILDFVGSIFSGGGGGLGGILGFASGGEVPFVSGMGMRNTDTALGRALKREGHDAVISTLTPGERVLTKDENRLYNALHPDGIMNIKVRNFNKGGELIPSISESVISGMSGRGSTNVAVNASIESQGGKGADERQLAKSIRAVVIAELARQDRIKNS